MHDNTILLLTLQVRHHELSLQPHEQKFQKLLPVLTPPIASTQRRINIDLQQATRLVQKLDEIKGITSNVLTGNLPSDTNEELLSLNDKVQEVSPKYDFPRIRLIIQAATGPFDRILKSSALALLLPCSAIPHLSPPIIAR